MFCHSVSLVCAIVIVYLVYSEIHDFLYSGVKFHFVPDDELDTRMDLNVDLTVAMPCRCKLNLCQTFFPATLSSWIFPDIGADVLDSTGQSVVSFGQLTEEASWFELSPRQRSHFEAAQRLNSMLRDKPHGIQQLLWKSGYQRLFGDMPDRLVHGNINFSLQMSP